MRPKERIPIFIKFINLKEYIDSIFKLDKKSFSDKLLNRNYKISSRERKSICTDILNNLAKIYYFWMDNPDLRFVQVLINLEFLDNYKVSMEYYREDDDILLEQGVEPRDCLLWGKIYDKKGNRLPVRQWMLIKNMETDHIANILKDVKEGEYIIPAKYIDALKEELEIKNNNQNELIQKEKSKTNST